MSNHLPFIHKTIFAFLLFVVLFIPQKSLATVFTIDISLTGGQEVPSNPSTGLGNLTGTYDDVTNTLSFDLVFTGLASPSTVAHFHGPAAPGVTALPVIAFAGFPGGVTSGSYTNSYVLTAPQEAELLCGLWYVNIHTTASPGGEIRGQLTEAAPSSFNITLAGTQEVPSNPSTGLANLTATYNDATNVLSFNLVFTGLASPTTVAHFHGPAAPGVSALPVIAFTGFPAGVTSGSYSNSYVLTATQETELLTGLWYVNIHTSTSPGGEIRGQLQEGTLYANCNPPPPAVTSFNPSTGPVGTSVTITGTNFNVVPANNIVYFGAVDAAVTSGTTMSLDVTVPAGAIYQPISVLDNTSGLIGYSSHPYITTFANPFGSGIPANFYAPKVDFTTGNTPRNVAAGDLDGDGMPDLVVANGNSDNVSVLHNTSTPGTISASSFAAKVDFASGFNGPVFGAIGDIDGDGKPDIVTANSGAASVSVRRNTSTPGSISFAAKVDFTTGSTPAAVAIGDVDGDGKPDLAVTNAAAGVNTLSVLRNTSTPGNISFTAKVDFATGATPRSVAIGDLDGDGKPDLVAANSATSPASTTISVLRNTSTAGIIDLTSFAAKVDFTAGTGPRYVAIGDADGDSKPDLVVANINSNSISVFRNTSTMGIIDASSFSAKVDFTTGNGPVSVAIVDIEGDGIPEVAAANGSAPYSVSVFQIDLSAVPVTLTSVKAYQKNAGVQLEWTVQQESNIDRYEVERSQNGQQFKKLGSVPAKGNSSAAINYNLFDPNPFSRVNFYRIKTIDKSGQETYSQVMKVNTGRGVATLITVYPNPVRGNTIVLQMNNLQKGKYTVTLTNKPGQQIMTKMINHTGGSATETIEPLKALAAGVYQLRFTGEGINITRQVIKN
jgi:hypothetical protein